MKLGLIARAAGAAVLVLSSAAVVQAAPVTYTIVSTTIGGDPVSGLGATGSLAVDFLRHTESAILQRNAAGFITFSGTIGADRTGNTIKFNQGASAIAANQSSSFGPGPGGDGGAAPANLAVKSESGGVLVAVRGLGVRPVSSSAATIDAAGNIPADAFQLEFTGGSIDFNSIDTGSFGSSDLSGFSLNESGTKPTIAQSDGVETLILPFQVSVPFSISQTDDSTLVFTGEMQAVRDVAVPEPAGLLVLPVAAGMLLRRRRGGIAIS